MKHDFQVVNKARKVSLYYRGDLLCRLSKRQFAELRRALDPAAKTTGRKL